MAPLLLLTGGSSGVGNCRRSAAALSRISCYAARASIVFSIGDIIILRHGQSLYDRSLCAPFYSFCGSYEGIPNGRSIECSIFACVLR